MPFLDRDGLAHLWNHIIARLNGKVEREELDDLEASMTEQINAKANSSHNHAASNITSGTLSSSRLPTVPITKGGTGATTAAAALTNLGITATAAELNKLDGVTATTAELNYVDGVTSNIQTQLNGKSSTSHEHSASKITSGILAIERGGTGNMYGYVRAGAEEGSTIGALATAEGRNVTASGSYCHAEGNYTEATGSSSHAEGQSTEASGNFSHAEGEGSIASGKSSHAEGQSTIAKGDYSHAQGKYNIEDTAGNYAHIVGNGTSNSARSNAHTVDWDGNAWFAGNVYVGGSGQNDAVASKVLTKAEIDSTLSISGRAADAKAVGDAISQLNNLIGDTSVADQIDSAMSEMNSIIAVDVNNDGNVELRSYAISSISSAEGVAF